MYGAFGKRIFDLVTALVALLVLSPLMLLIAILIKGIDPGPVIFRQQRVGINGRMFDFYKFRSMPVDTSDIPSDRLGEIRMSWVGRLIRRSNIDELPQLVNIVLGDMSIVGPRPPIASQTELVGLRRQNGALACRPGLTGLAQVKSFDGMSVAQKAAFDASYAQSVTLLNDLKIILNTVVYLLKPPPVY
jgi:O-antigen biosynthesis protein WbqP